MTDINERDDDEQREVVINPDDPHATGLILAGLIRTCPTDLISAWDAMLAKLRGDLDDRRAMSLNAPPRLTLIVGNAHGTYAPPYLQSTCTHCRTPWTDGDVAILTDPDTFEDHRRALARNGIQGLPLDEETLGMTHPVACLTCVFSTSLPDADVDALLTRARAIGALAVQVRVQHVPLAD